MFASKSVKIFEPERDKLTYPKHCPLASSQSLAVSESRSKYLRDLSTRPSSARAQHRLDKSPHGIREKEL